MVLGACTEVLVSMQVVIMQRLVRLLHRILVCLHANPGRAVSDEELEHEERGVHGRVLIYFNAVLLTLLFIYVRDSCADDVRHLLCMTEVHRLELEVSPGIELDFVPSHVHSLHHVRVEERFSG